MTWHARPQAVGGMSMITTSNYVARRYGVRAAMPGFIARKLCPALVLVPPRFDAYVAAAHNLTGMFDCATLSMPLGLSSLTARLAARPWWLWDLLRVLPALAGEGASL